MAQRITNKGVNLVKYETLKMFNSSSSALIPFERSLNKCTLVGVTCGLAWTYIPDFKFHPPYT